MIYYLLISFGLTIATECPVAFLLGLRDKRSQLIVFLANVITNPLLVYTMRMLHLMGCPGEHLILALLELLAFGVEVLIYCRAFGSGKRGLMLSLLLNTASFAVGTVVQYLL